MNLFGGAPTSERWWQHGKGVIASIKRLKVTFVMEKEKGVDMAVVEEDLYLLYLKEELTGNDFTSSKGVI